MARKDRLPKNNTNVMCTNGRIAVTLHRTLVVDVTPDDITLNTGGWNTVTTRARMNQASAEFGLGYSVFMKRGQLFVTMRDGTTEAFDQEITFPR